MKWDFNDAMEMPRTMMYPREVIECEKILRKFKISLIINGKKIIKNENNILLKDWKRAKKLSDNGFIIGGSFVLKLNGLIERNIDDLDVFKKDIELPEKHKIGNYNSSIERYKFQTKEYGQVDVFKCEIDYEIYNGIKISKIYPIYEKKIEYKRMKDYYDMIYLKNNFLT